MQEPSRNPAGNVPAGDDRQETVDGQVATRERTVTMHMSGPPTLMGMLDIVLDQVALDWEGSVPPVTLVVLGLQLSQKAEHEAERDFDQLSRFMQADHERLLRKRGMAVALTTDAAAAE